MSSAKQLIVNDSLKVDANRLEVQSEEKKTFVFHHTSAMIFLLCLYSSITHRHSMNLVVAFDTLKSVDDNRECVETFRMFHNIFPISSQRHEIVSSVWCKCRKAKQFSYLFYPLHFQTVKQTVRNDFTMSFVFPQLHKALQSKSQ